MPLSLFQTYCAAHGSTHGKLFVPLLKKWYNDDIVSEDGILEWYKSPRSSKPSSSSTEFLSLGIDGTRAKAGQFDEVDLGLLSEFKKQAQDVIRFILEEEDSEEDDDEEEDE